MHEENYRFHLYKLSISYTKKKSNNAFKHKIDIYIYNLEIAIDLCTFNISYHKHEIYVQS